MIRYAVQLQTRYDGLVIATFPDLPGVTALGCDDEEALSEAGRALADALAGYAEDGVEAPAPMARGAAMIAAAPVARPIPA